MPSLNWIGKDKVINHHNEVPYRVLEKKYRYGDEKSENMIIHGDNLEALKSLLPKHEGTIDCIYIDPPYNTGNEGWIYNDNVNDPRIKKWLGEVVGKEGEDLSRHDKWLCMMYPRLRLLHKLLALDGVIFVSIDDIEYANLKGIMDEIFGTSCFISNISWQRTYSTRNDSKGIVNEVEHILVYSKQPNWQPQKLPRTVEMNAKYKNPDNDIAEWRSDNPYATDAATHQGMVYAIQHPFTGELLYPANGSHWRYSQDVMLDSMNGWCDYVLKDLNDAKKRAEICGITPAEVREGVLGIVLKDSLDISRKKAESVYHRGQWPRFFFSKNGLGGIARKTYLKNVGGVPPTNLWTFKDTGHTDEAKKEILSIFNGKAAFDTPKPVRLIEYILKISDKDKMIVLDSFAGSGTTAHAVLKMNNKDNKDRKFILIEMGEYSNSITAERVRKAISGYGEGKNANKGLGGGFTYYELGEPLFLENDVLNPNISDKNIREYVWYSETKTPLSNELNSDNKYYLGVHNDTAYYFNYEKDHISVLDNEFLKTIKIKSNAYVIYADTCNLSTAKMNKYNITFKKIPRDIARL